MADAQASLSAIIIELRQTGASADVVAQGEIQLAALMGLRRQLATATPATMAGIRAEVASCVAAAGRIAQQAQTAAAGSGMGVAGTTLAAASESARNAVKSFEEDYYRQKKFEGYLHFSSAGDETEFRRREEERRKEIEQARALRTPEGDLLATKLAIQQMNDAGAHGASDSPDFREDLGRLEQARANLSKAIAARSPSAESKQQEAAAESDPLDAIKPSLEASRDQIAKLRAAGVIHAAQGEGHGININQAQQGAVGRGPT